MGERDELEHRLEIQHREAQRQAERTEAMMTSITKGYEDQLSRGRLETHTSRTTSVVSDTIIGPKPFTGRSTDNNEAEDWLSYFKRYCGHKGWNEKESASVFKLLMRDAAADWLASLTGSLGEVDSNEYEEGDLEKLCAAFEHNYFRPAELRWKESQALWGATTAVE